MTFFFTARVRRNHTWLCFLAISLLYTTACGTKAPEQTSDNATPASPPTAAAPASAPAAPPVANAPSSSSAPASKVALTSLPGYKKWKDKKNPVSATAANLDKGKQLFLKDCASCHGNEGQGDGVAGTSLNPPPRNFSTDSFKLGHDDWMLMRTVMEGSPGTGMVGWQGRMTDQEAWTVVNYVKTLRKS